MSRKNHVMTDRGLLQTDKKFSALKERQKMKIAEWMYEAYRKCYVESGKIPGKGKEREVLGYVFRKIDDAGIWIPDREIYQYYRSRKTKLLKRLKKEFANDLAEQNEQSNR